MPLERDATVLQHDEFSLLGFIRISANNLQHPIVTPHRLVRRHVESVAQLVRHQDRADILQVAKLDDLIVDRGGRDRVETRSRLIVE